MTKELTKPTITKAQAMKLCEEIREGIGAIGEKLYQLHKGTGWTVLGYLTWKDCCEQEFRHSTWWANNQLRIAEVRKALPPPPPQTPPQRGKEWVAPSRREAPQSDGKLSDRAVSELAKVPEEDRPAVLAQAAEASDGKPPTAKAIQQAAKPSGPAPTKPPKQYPRSHWFKQWEMSIGPLVRLVDKIAGAVGEKQTVHHDAVQAKLNDATVQMMKWMGVKK